MRGELIVAGTFLGGAVEVVVARHPDLARACDKSLDELVPFPDVRDAQWPPFAVEGARTAPVGLGADEQRQHIIKAPAPIAQCGPIVIVLALATDVDQPVD